VRRSPTTGKTVDFDRLFTDPPRGCLVGLVGGIAYVLEAGGAFEARRVEALSSGRSLRVGGLPATPQETLYALDAMARYAEGGAIRKALDLPDPRLLAHRIARPPTRLPADPLAWARLQAPADGPVPTDAHLRHLLCLPFVVDEFHVRMLASLPVDWIPRGDEEVAAFQSLSALFRSTSMTAPGAMAWRDHDLVLAFGGYGFLRGVRGRWKPFLDRIGESSRERHVRIEGVIDMVRSFAEDAVVPALAGEGLVPEGFHDIHLCVPPVAVAARVLFEGKSLHAILEESDDWHRRIAGTVAVRGADPSDTWPVPFDTATAPNGLVLRCLPDASSLADEGLAMRHCVGTYAAQCRHGHAVVVSIRSPDGNRLSTLELRPAGATYAIGQNHGIMNTRPPPEAAEAARWLLGEIGAPIASVRTGPAPYAPAHNPGAAARRMPAHTAWERHLRRPLRSEPALRAAILRAAVHVLQTRYRPGTGIGPDGTPDNASLRWDRQGKTPLLGKFDIEAWFRSRTPGMEPRRRTQMARLASVGALPLGLLATMALLLPLVRFLGPMALAPSLAVVPIALASMIAVRMPWSARRARRRWEARAKGIADALDPPAPVPARTVPPRPVTVASA
jgi:hypothetical protein